MFVLVPLVCLKGAISMENKHIGAKLKELRLARGLRQYEVADGVGVSRAMISNLEAGRRSLTLETLKTFADFYKVTLDYFELGQFSEMDEMTDLLERTRKLFENENVPTDMKEDLYLTIMELYLKLKKSSAS